MAVERLIPSEFTGDVLIYTDAEPDDMIALTMLEKMGIVPSHLLCVRRDDGYDRNAHMQRFLESHPSWQRAKYEYAHSDALSDAISEFVQMESSEHKAIISLASMTALFSARNRSFLKDVTVLQYGSVNIRWAHKENGLSRDQKDMVQLLTYGFGKCYLYESWFATGDCNQVNEEFGPALRRVFLADDVIRESIKEWNTHMANKSIRKLISYSQDLKGLTIENTHEFLRDNKLGDSQYAKILLKIAEDPYQVVAADFFAIASLFDLANYHPRCVDIDNGFTTYGPADDKSTALCYIGDSSKTPIERLTHLADIVLAVL